MSAAFDALRNSWLGAAMRETPNLFPAMEMTHFAGLTLLIGAIMIVDLRIIGLWRGTSYAAFFKLIPLAIAGFALNVISGVCLFSSNPALYTTNNAFWAKMVLILVGGLNALWFMLAEQRKLELGPPTAAPATARLMAGASLTLWIMVLLLGRLLPYLAPTGGG